MHPELAKRPLVTEEWHICDSSNPQPRLSHAGFSFGHPAVPLPLVFFSAKYIPGSPGRRAHELQGALVRKACLAFRKEADRMNELIRLVGLVCFEVTLHDLVILPLV